MRRMKRKLAASFVVTVAVMPGCKKGVTTIKMISNTSMMSTIGVTLISD